MALVATPFKSLNDLCDLLGIAKDAKVRSIKLHVSACVNDVTTIRAEVEQIATNEQMEKLQEIVRNESPDGVEVDVKTIGVLALAKGEVAFNVECDKCGLVVGVKAGVRNECPRCAARNATTVEKFSEQTGIPLGQAASILADAADVFSAADTPTIVEKP